MPCCYCISCITSSPLHIAVSVHPLAGSCEVSLAVVDSTAWPFPVYLPSFFTSNHAPLHSFDPVSPCAPRDRRPLALSPTRPSDRTTSPSSTTRYLHIKSERISLQLLVAVRLCDWPPACRCALHEQGSKLEALDASCCIAGHPACAHTSAGLNEHHFSLA